MTVYQLGSLRSSSYISRGIGAQYRNQNKYDASIYRALGLNRRVGKGSRFNYNQNLKHPIYAEAQESTSEEKKFNWGNALGGGLSMGLSGATVGAMIGGGPGAIIGGAVGLVGGFFAGGFG